MDERVRISFNGTSPAGGGPLAVIYNPLVLPTALLSQVMRFGLRMERQGGSSMSGNLKGDQDAFVGMIQSYGVAVDIVPATVVLP